MKTILRFQLLSIVLIYLIFGYSIYAQSTDDGIYISSGPDTIQIKKPFTYTSFFEDWDMNGTYVDFWNWSARLVHNDSVYTILSKDSVPGFDKWQCSWTDSVVHIPFPLDSIYNDLFVIVVEYFDSDSIYHTNNKFISNILDSMISTIQPSTNFLPNEIQLFQNYPNPFNPITTIQFSLKESGTVQLYVFNHLGQKVKTIINNKKYSIGAIHQVQWDGTIQDGTKAASGIYYYKLISENQSQVKKMILLR